ncbi:MAG: PliI family lysozyme inhibitor of I-type lysozyme [Cohaesibacter sp.]|jgi:hypothetical protein|nr:PliI family lysozyme inhibitor of I-type lysozyme [Cohaesibacter sp.]
MACIPSTQLSLISPRLAKWVGNRQFCLPFLSPQHLRGLYLSLLGLPFLLSPALALGKKDLALERLGAKHKIDQLLTQRGAEGTIGHFVRQSGAWYRILSCENGTADLCLVRSKPASDPALPKAQGPALGDAKVATSPAGDIRAAWLTQPTTRYAHGVLGDAIEAGGVTVLLDDGRYESFTLPQDSVFEDIIPRLADLDGDGRNELVLVRSYSKAGAALAVLGMRDGKLKIVAENEPIGIANRWLNPSILANLGSNGRLSIGLVRTPHIGGQLQIWQFDGKRLKQTGRANGFSNHSIGSRALGLSAIVRHGPEKRIVIPDAGQKALIVLDGTSLEPLARIALPARPATDFATLTQPTGKQQVVLGLEDGSLYSLSSPKGRLFD